MVRQRRLFQYLLLLVAFGIFEIGLVIYWDDHHEEEEPLEEGCDYYILQADQKSTAPRYPYQQFYSLEGAEQFMRNVSIKDMGQIKIRYEHFITSLPNFENDADKDLFLQSDLIQSNLGRTPDERLRGEITVIQHGRFQMFYECGWMSDVREWKSTKRPHKCYDYLAPLIVPMAFLYQHFVDGTLPKLFQAFELLRRPHVKIILEKPLSSSVNIHNILQKLNISAKRIVWHERGDTDTVYYARYMIHTCVTPPLHPVLWNRLRHGFNVSESRQMPWRDGKVILLQRLGTSALTRRISNLQEIHSYLEDRYGSNLVTFSGGYNLKESMKLFSRAKIIIGAHGGALYNMQFSAKGTVVIELSPVRPGGADPYALPHAIFWRIASMIGHNYWRIPIITPSLDNNMRVDVHKLNRILNIVDNTTSQTLDKPGF